MTPEQVSDAYNDHCTALRALGDLLRESAEVRWSPSPVGGITRAPGEVANPTLETVLDPARMEVSDAIDKAAVALLRSRRDLEAVNASLRAAVETWQGAGPSPI